MYVSCSLKVILLIANSRNRRMKFPDYHHSAINLKRLKPQITVHWRQYTFQINFYISNNTYRVEKKEQSNGSPSVQFCHFPRHARKWKKCFKVFRNKNISMFQLLWMWFLKSIQHWRQRLQFFFNIQRNDSFSVN